MTLLKMVSCGPVAFVNGTAMQRQGNALHFGGVLVTLPPRAKSPAPKRGITPNRLKARKNCPAAAGGKNQPPLSKKGETLWNGGKNRSSIKFTPAAFRTPTATVWAISPASLAVWIICGSWVWDEERGQYYLHLFAKNQADLNYHCPGLLEEIKQILRFWLDKGVARF